MYTLIITAALHVIAKSRNKHTDNAFFGKWNSICLSDETSLNAEHPTQSPRWGG